MEPSAWRRPKQASCWTLHGHADLATDVSFDSSQGNLASASWDGTIKIWDLHGGKSDFKLQHHKRPVSDLAYSPDGTYLLSACENEDTIQISQSDGNNIRAIRLAGNLCRATFSPDSRHFGVATNSGIRIYETTSGRLTTSLDESSAQALVFTPDGLKVLATCLRLSRPPQAPPGTRSQPSVELKLWDWQQGDEQLLGTFEVSATDSLDVSHDGQSVAFGVNRNQVIVRNLASGKEIVLSGHEGLVHRVRFSPNSAWIGSVAFDDTVIIWDSVTGRELYRFDDQKVDGYFDLAFSPDGQRVSAVGGQLAGNRIGIVHLWDMSSGAHVLTLRGHQLGISSIAFSPDGNKLATGGFRGEVVIWDTSFGTRPRQ